MRGAALLLALALSGEATAQQADIRFIACPMYRDTDQGKKSGCWLADDAATGMRYDVGMGPVKPDWNHEVLIEGRVSTTADACGGVVLDPVRVSVLPGACTRHSLPAEGHPGRVFALPQRNVRPLYEARATPAPPYAEKTFTLTYSWEADFTIYQLDDFYLDQAITWIRAVRPSRITVTGYGATRPAQVSGRTIAESPGIAQRRAQTVTESLVRLGVDPARIRTEWRNSAEPSDAPGADGLAEASRRRVDIRVTP
jgi:hypothetical protein